jgi:trk system potassium uptake protein TrkA
VKALVIGCGRVGSSVAKQLAGDGWDVTCVDEDETALARLGAWRGGFLPGHGMDVDVLERAGVSEADAAVVATNGDNTNIVVGQVLRARWRIPRVIVRILDPARAEFFAQRGMVTVCPTKTAIAEIVDHVQVPVARQAD